MDLARINQIFQEIGTFTIDLSADPTVLGPQYLNKLIAQCRNYLNRTASILLAIAQEKVMTENELENEKGAYQIAFDEMLATNEQVQKAPNIRDREALINTQLSDRTKRIHALETDVRNLNAVDKAVRVRHNELIRTDGQIKTQRSLIRDEIDTKSYMGDEHNEGRKGSTIDEDELEQMMNDMPATGPQAPQGNSTSLFTLPESEMPATAPAEEPEEESILAKEVPLSTLAIPTPSPGVKAAYEAAYASDPTEDAAVERGVDILFDEAKKRPEGFAVGVLDVVADSALTAGTAAREIQEMLAEKSVQEPAEVVVIETLQHVKIIASVDTKAEPKVSKSAADDDDIMSLLEEEPPMAPPAKPSAPVVVEEVKVEAPVAAAPPVAAAAPPPPPEPAAEVDPLEDAMSIVASLEATETSAPIQEAPVVRKEEIQEAVVTSPGGTDEAGIERFLKDGPESTPSKGSKKGKKDKAATKSEPVTDVELLVTQESTVVADSNFEDILAKL